MDDAIIISNLNDFIFCPVSIYFHNLYGDQETITYQSSDQINGTKAHETVDDGTYSTRKDILCGLSVYSEKYNVVGKIDIYDATAHALTERKRTIKRIYDGYVYQLYAQCFGLREMGYVVEKIFLYSMTDNKKYEVRLPEDDDAMRTGFETLIKNMREFNIATFTQTNREKCLKCIYEPACDRGLLC